MDGFWCLRCHYNYIEVYYLMLVNEIESKLLYINLEVILSCRGDRYCHLDTLNTKIHPLVMILSTVVEYFFSSIFGHQGDIDAICK